MFDAQMTSLSGKGLGGVKKENKIWTDTETETRTTFVIVNSHYDAIFVPQNQLLF